MLILRATLFWLPKHRLLYNQTLRGPLGPRAKVKRCHSTCQIQIANVFEPTVTDQQSESFLIWKARHRVRQVFISASRSTYYAAQQRQQFREVQLKAGPKGQLWL